MKRCIPMVVEVAPRAGVLARLELRGEAVPEEAIVITNKIEGTDRVCRVRIPDLLRLATLRIRYVQDRPHPLV
jgi:hypothetical protein